MWVPFRLCSCLPQLSYNTPSAECLSPKSPFPPESTAVPACSLRQAQQAPASLSPRPHHKHEHIQHRKKSSRNSWCPSHPWTAGHQGRPSACSPVRQLGLRNERRTPTGTLTVSSQPRRACGTQGSTGGGAARLPPPPEGQLSWAK